MSRVPSHYDAKRFHRALAHFNVVRLAMGSPSKDWAEALEYEYKFRYEEGLYLEAMRANVASLMPNPQLAGQGFIDWFSELIHFGPGQQHPLFDWLAQEATMPQLRWFLTQEAAGEAGFEDLLAMTQVKLPARPKLECARNFWDEMGHGKRAGMHGEMLLQMVRGLNLQPSIGTTVYEALALSNTMIGLATSRRYVYHAIGALGAIELTAPGRVKKVSLAMRRLGLDGKMRAYLDLHGALDISHGAAWIREVIHPLIDADPGCAAFIAEGALMRLQCGERCFDRYSSIMSIGSQSDVVTCDHFLPEQIE